MSWVRLKDPIVQSQNLNAIMGDVAGILLMASLQRTGVPRLCW